MFSFNHNLKKVAWSVSVDLLMLFRFIQKLTWWTFMLSLFHFISFFCCASFVDLVTTADEYLLIWFLLIWKFTLFEIIGGIILDLVESVHVIWFHLVQLAFIHPVTLEVSDEHSSTCQPDLCLSMEQCLLQLWWALLPASYISLCL